ncbi:hypothetical protein LSH36_1367g00024, partial [Paralvinella palmiformis]
SGVLVSHVLMLQMLVKIIPMNNYPVPILGFIQGNNTVIKLNPYIVLSISAMLYVANFVLISLSLVMSSIGICLWNKAKRNAIGVPRLVVKVIP